jgi:DNA-binding NtrC family response regulator
LALQRVGDLQEALAAIANGGVAGIVLNCPVGETSADELVQDLQEAEPALPVVVVDPAASLADAVRLVKKGIHHFFGPEIFGEECRTFELRAVLEELLEADAVPPPAMDEPWRKHLVGASPVFDQVIEMIRLVGPRRATVLITGETGTGKEMVARALHLASPRQHQPWVAVNCSALPENLLEAELFGHVRGAFTGAVQTRIGRFEQAHRGTLFLDEIAEMPLDVQVKLLRVLQEREFQRLGSSETIRVDTRVIAACNADLGERVRQGRFREDLYYRLNVVPMVLPSLRERASDIPALARHFVEKVCRNEGLPVKRLTPEAIVMLTHYPWPGNVRQLENAIETAVALSGDRELLRPADFLLELRSRAAPERPMPSRIAVPEEGLDFEQVVGAIERDLLQQALARSGGNKKRAAEMLRLKRTTLAAKLRSLEAACA